MTAPGIVISLFGLLVLGGGIIGYTNTANIASLIAGGASGLGLLASGLGVLRRKELGFVFAPFYNRPANGIFRLPFSAER
jgi:uncharacterized membrane protein (UPF0136 family)